MKERMEELEERANRKTHAITTLLLQWAEYSKRIDKMPGHASYSLQAAQYDCIKELQREGVVFPEDFKY